LVPSVAGKNNEAREILKRVSALKMELPGKACAGCTAIHGGKRAVDWSQFRPRGSGPPRYDGWYPDLFYARGSMFEWKPTIADVHTDPESGGVLEVGVGDANFLVLAVDSAACGSGHSVYVGPAYSYYEFTQPASSRMTDSEWETRLGTPGPPQRPAWTSPFVAPASARHLNQPPPKPRPTPGQGPKR
jgi:hypothetical protein